MLVDHGSVLPEANQVVERVATALRARLPEASVYVAHLEKVEPSVAEALEACAAQGAGGIDLLPYFLGPGRHASKDLPALAAAFEASHPGVAVRVCDPLGYHEAIVDVVLARLSEDGDPDRTG